jgi:hypothetical protein
MKNQLNQCLEDFAHQLQRLLEGPEEVVPREYTFLDRDGEWVKCPPSPVSLHPFSQAVVQQPYEAMYDEILHQFLTGQMEFETELRLIYLNSYLRQACLKLLEIDEQNDKSGVDLVNLHDAANFINFGVFYFKLARLLYCHGPFSVSERGRLQEVFFHMYVVGINSDFLNMMLLESGERIFEDACYRLDDFIVFDMEVIHELLVQEKSFPQAYYVQEAQTLQTYLEQLDSPHELQKGMARVETIFASTSEPRAREFCLQYGFKFLKAIRQAMGQSVPRPLKSEMFRVARKVS